MLDCMAVDAVYGEPLSSTPCLKRRLTLLSACQPVPTENSESSEKSRVLGWAAVVSPARLSSSDRSFLGLYADSVIGRLWN